MSDTENAPAFDESKMDPENAELEDAPVNVGDSGVAARRVTWVLAIDGIVAKVVKTYNYLVHPFTVDDDAHIAQNDGSRMIIPMKGVAVLPAAGMDVVPGMLVDTKGNFTATEGRIARLHPSEPAYLAGPQPVVADGAGSRRDPDEVLKATQDRVEEHQEKVEELQEKLASDEPHDQMEVVVLNTEGSTRTAEDVKAEEDPKSK